VFPLNILPPILNTTANAIVMGHVKPLIPEDKCEWSNRVGVLFLGALTKVRKATIGFVICVNPSVGPSAWNNTAPSGRILMKFDI
jgi:hypothetical protein